MLRYGLKNLKPVECPLCKGERKYATKIAEEMEMHVRVSSFVFRKTLTLETHFNFYEIDRL